MSKAIELITQVKDLCKISDTTYDTLILQKLNLVQWQLFNMHYHWRDLEAYETLTTTETMTLDVPPSVDWNVGDTITGTTSGKTCVISEFVSDLVYYTKDRSGAFTLGEILSNGTYTADQGAANPIFTANSFTSTPSDMGVLYDVRQTEASPYAELIYVTPSRFHLVVPQPAEFSTEKPLYYTWWGGKLWWYPIPDTSYDMTIYYYRKPTNMKLYSAGTAAASGTALAGTTTYWKDNNNVEAGMYFAYASDVLSDGTYPWGLIHSITTNAVGALEDTYAGAGTTAASYWASSASTFTEFFDLALIYGTVIMMSASFRELRESAPWFQEQYKAQLSALAESQTAIPDYKPIAEDFTPLKSRLPITGDAYKYPFIRSDV